MIEGAVELTIETVGAQGDGVAAGPVFAPFTLPGERVAARVEGDRAAVEAVLQASVERVAPACRHFGACGGCALQHWAHAPYLAWKVDRLRETLARAGLTPEFTPAFAAPPGSRRRVALHARSGPDGPRLGYKARGAWTLVDVQECAISAPAIVAALPALRRLGGAFLGGAKSAPTLHVTLTDTGIDVDVSGVEKRGGALPPAMYARSAEAAVAGDFARVTLDGTAIHESRAPTVRFGRATVTLPPGGFLQAVEAAEAAMAAVAVEALRAAGKVADLFSGAGAFSFRLAETAAVTAVDGSAPAIGALNRAVGAARGLKPVRGEVRDLMRRPLAAGELNRFDGVVFDPPRAGAEAQARLLAESRVPVVVGVSCNPTTFARDARLLVDGGYRLDGVTPVDQFLWSPHIELVGVFRR